MAYLYAALGLSMFTGILAMFQMSNALLKQQILSKSPDDSYSQTVLQTNDKRFLQVLENSNSTWGTGDTLCESVKQEIATLGEEFNSITDYYEINANNSSSNRFQGTCYLGKDNHRVLITPNNEEDSINLFSCILNKKIVCDFEESN